MRTLTGTVVSNHMDKTLVVAVDTYKTHEKYKKRYKVTQKFYVHDEENVGNVGDVVSFSETRPLSKSKRWMLVQA